MRLIGRSLAKVSPECEIMPAFRALISVEPGSKRASTQYWEIGMHVTVTTVHSRRDLYLALQIKNACALELDAIALYSAQYRAAARGRLVGVDR